MGTHLISTTHSVFKKKILEGAIQKLQTLIDDLKQNIRELLQSEEKVNEGEFDLSQQAFNAELLFKVNALAGQLNFANEEMQVLYSLLPLTEKDHYSIQEGCVVVTDKKTFFISTSIGPFIVYGAKIYGISTHSPLYKVMEGKQKDDTFSYKAYEYKIREVF